MFIGHFALGFAAKAAVPRVSLGTLFLAALLKAQAQRIPLAPTRSAAVRVLDALQSRALIQVPWPADRWQIRPDAEVTPGTGCTAPARA